MEVANESKQFDLKLRAHLVRLFYLSAVSWDAKVMSETCGNALIIWKEAKKAVRGKF